MAFVSAPWADYLKFDKDGKPYLPNNAPDEVKKAYASYLYTKTPEYRKKLRIE